MRHLSVFTALAAAALLAACGQTPPAPTPVTPPPTAQTAPEVKALATSTYNPNGFDAVKTMQEIQHPHPDLVILSSHRGNHALVDGQYPLVPENSLEAIGLSAQSGIEEIEIDVKLTQDGIPILSHDTTWGRELCNTGGFTSSGQFDPFAAPSPSNDYYNPAVNSWSLSYLRSGVDKPFIRDSVAVDCVKNAIHYGIPAPTLQEALDYIRTNKIAMVLALDLRDASTTNAAWNVISKNSDYLGRNYLLSTLFKVPAKAFASPQDVVRALPSGGGLYTPNFQPVYNTGDISPGLLLDNSISGTGASFGVNGYGSEQAIINSLVAFENDPGINVTAVEIQIKQVNGILTSVLTAAKRNSRTGQPENVSVFSPYVDYFAPGDTNKTDPLFFKTNGYCCVRLSDFYYNGAPNGQPSDTGDSRGDLDYLIRQGFNSITTDNPVSYDRRLAGVGKRYLARIQDTSIDSGGSSGAPPQQPQPPSTGQAPGEFLNHRALLGNVDPDPEWFLKNIPFLEVPDTQIQQVYYYRWHTYKEHLLPLRLTNGWLSTEFLSPPFYSAPSGGINAAAGHHISEGRWLRDQQYVRGVINYWLNGPGQSVKPQNEGLNPDTSDWAHQYSFWAASAVWQTYLATGDKAFSTALLPKLVTQYRGWDNHFNVDLGLYWQVPVWDATEFTPASYESSDPYHGGAGYRPTINAYQYGDAVAISDLAGLANKVDVKFEYTARADSLDAATNRFLWDSNRGFYYHMNRDNNPGHTLLGSREEQGFLPWMFGMRTAPDSARAFSQLLDPQGFQSDYGPPTAERRSKWFMYDANKGCCRWDGPSWPFATSQTLTALANLLIQYEKNPYITPNDYVRLLHTYAATQYKDGQPYIAEAHNPDSNSWI